MARAFVAVALPDPVLDAVEGVVAGVPVPGRPTTRDQWHLTLQFLGDGADVDALTVALQGLPVAAGRAQLGGAGAFPRARRAQVLWLGLSDGAELLARLAVAVAERTTALGYEADPRAYRPHVTVARFRTATDARAAVAAIGDAPIGPAWRVDAVTVFESTLRPEGARYDARATLPLGA